MFNRQYFAARAFAPRYFPPVPVTDDDEVIAGGRRVQGDPVASAQVVQHGSSHARIVARAAANTRVKRG